MRRRYLFIGQLLLIVLIHLQSQDRYKVSMNAVSTADNDEFCPVPYRDQLIYCSDRDYDLLASFESIDRSGHINIYAFPSSDSFKRPNPRILSKNLTSVYNDGPVSYCLEKGMIVYSRNQQIKKKLRNSIRTKNRLGLFFSKEQGVLWTEAVPFPFNNPDYNSTTPCWGKDGGSLFFASDMPGGFGGTDLYVSRLVEGTWSKPENLGRLVNTPGNELFPFICENGNLFFSSDGHPGYGGKDLYVSARESKMWSKPVHLEAPLNSSADDFGLVTDKTFTEGYFSSNRASSDDIYHFHTLVPQLSECDTLMKNEYCYEFWDDRYTENDTSTLEFMWEFSDGVVLPGTRVWHCLPGPGKYWAKFIVSDVQNEGTFNTQTMMEFELKDHIQPYITGPDTIQLNHEAHFDGSKSNLPGFHIQEYIWEFGNKSFATGEQVTHIFEHAGSYDVKLGLKGVNPEIEKSQIHCITKKIEVIEP